MAGSGEPVSLGPAPVPPGRNRIPVRGFRAFVTDSHRSSDLSHPPTPAPPPAPHEQAERDGDDARLGARAIAGAVRVELLGLERGLLGEVVGLLLDPLATARRLADEAERPLATALRLFLLANLVFFLVGPTVGLMDYSLDSLAGFPGYAEMIRAQMERLGVGVEVYRARFDTAFDFRQPTLVIVMLPLLAGAGAAALRRGAVGRHLMAALLGLSWVLLVWPALRVVDALVAETGAPFEVTVPLLITLLLGSALWVWTRLGQGLFGLGRWARLAYGVALTAATVVALVFHGQVTFWVTFALLELGI